MNFWDSITSFISDIWSGTSGEILGSIQDTAVSVVSDLENVSGMNGAEKREIAYERIVTQAKNEGKKIIKNVVYASIETALMSIRK